MRFLLGFDPGGAGAFGWCVAKEERRDPPLAIVGRGVADDAVAAVDRAVASLEADRHDIVVGIDAPLFWVGAGDRCVDAAVRAAVCRRGGRGGTVNHVNSMRGACLIQGVIADMKLRAMFENVPMTESHPKALMWLLGIANRGLPIANISLRQHLGAFFRDNAQLANPSDHERDAALACLSAWAMANRLAGWTDIYRLDLNAPPFSPLVPPPAYWVPDLQP